MSRRLAACAAVSRCGEATLVLHILRLFQAYTHFGLGSLEGLDNERFIKLMSDGSVIDDRCASTHMHNQNLNISIHPSTFFAQSEKTILIFVYVCCTHYATDASVNYHLARNRLTPAVTSMVFSKCKSKYLEKMDFAQFLGSLVVLAEVKGVPALVLARELIQAPGLSQIHSGATPRQVGQGYGTMLPTEPPLYTDIHSDERN
jgi:hypothetical protein